MRSSGVQSRRALSFLVLVLGVAGAALVPVAPAAAADAGHVVVAPWGQEGASGTEQDPLASIEEAFSLVEPGGQVVLHGGTYDEDVVVNVDADPSAAPVLVVPAPGETPVLRGRLWLRRPSNWHISGLEVTWREDLAGDMHLVKITGGVGWTLEGLWVHGARSYAAILVAGLDAQPSEPSGWQVRDSCITDTIPTNDTNQDHLIYVNSGIGSAGGSITGNILVGAPNGEAVKLGGPSPDVGGTANVVVSGNTIADVAQGVLIAGRSHDNVVEGNRFGPIEEPYAAVRAFRLDNDSNVVRDNVTYGADLLLQHDSLGAVLDGGGNVVRPVQEWQQPTCGLPASAPPLVTLPYYARRSR